jgi:hypothetical protein
MIVAALVGLLASPAFAQAKAEISGYYGWTFSDGVSFSGTPVNGATYTRADPKDSQSYGFTFGIYFTPQAEIEFLWGRQASKLEVTGTGPKLSGDMNVDTYHGNFIYNFGAAEAVARPFIFIGVGATNYGDATFPATTVPGLTKFSWAFGGGIKAYPSKNVGFKAMARWTPTYIKTDGYGWWCDPFWGCAPVGNVQYSNQVEFSGGLLLRF